MEDERIFDDDEMDELHANPEVLAWAVDQVLCHDMRIGDLRLQVRDRLAAAKIGVDRPSTGH